MYLHFWSDKSLKSISYVPNTLATNLATVFNLFDHIWLYIDPFEFSIIDFNSVRIASVMSNETCISFPFIKSIRVKACFPKLSNYNKKSDTIMTSFSFK